MLYTRKGDTGTSGLFGTKKRYAKDEPVYDALGTLDELNSLLGFCKAFASHHKHGARVSLELSNVQQCLFTIQAEVAGATHTLNEKNVTDLERTIDTLEAGFEHHRGFVVPGSTELSGLLDYARAVSRRAERTVLKVAGERDLSDPTRAYLNRLSSLLYVLARHTAASEGTQEMSPSY